MKTRLEQIAVITDYLVSFIPDDFDSKAGLVDWIENSPYSPYVTLYGGESALGFSEAGSFISEIDGLKRFNLRDSFSFKLENFVNFENKILSGGGRLAEIVNSETLFENYPEFRDIDVSINISNSDKGFKSGSFNVTKNKIEIFAGSNKGAMLVLLHELQHAIQVKEGFALGESYYQEDGVMDLFVGLDQTSNQKEMIKLYHGTNAEFDSFEKMGNRLTSIGYGHYFSPDIEMAKEYGKNIKEIEIEKDLILDLRSPTDKQREEIVKLLDEVVPEYIKAGYGGVKRIDITDMDDNDALKLYKEKKEDTKDFYHDRAKAQIIEDYESGKIYIQWQEAGLENATASNLLNLLQEYRQNIPVELGYKAAMNGSEVAIYDTKFVNELLHKNNLIEGAFSDIATQKSMIEIGDNEIILKEYPYSLSEAVENYRIKAFINENEPLTEEIWNNIKHFKNYTEEQFFNEADKIQEQIRELLKDDDKLKNRINELEALLDKRTPYDSMKTLMKMRKYGKLSDYIEHSALFKKYPQLENLHIRFDDMGHAKGKYQRKTEWNEEQVVLSEDYLGVAHLKNDMLSTLSHEVQHVIQEIEGWARGGSPEQFAKPSVFWEKRLDLLEEWRKSKEELKLFPDTLVAKLNKLSDEYFLLTGNMPTDNAINEVRKEYKESLLNSAKKEGYEKYKQLWGEQQARAASYRVDMSSAERLSEDWTKTLERAEGEYNEPIIKFDLDGIAQAIELEERYLNEHGNLEEDFILEDGVDKLPRFVTSFKKFEKLFKNRISSSFALLDTPIGGVKVHLRSAFDHFTVNTNRANRTRFNGGLIPVFENPLFVVKDKYEGKDVVVFYKPMISKKKQEGMLHFAGYAVDDKGKIQNTTYFDITKARLEKYIKTEEENLLYFKYAGANLKLECSDNITISEETRTYDDIVAKNNTVVKGLFTTGCERSAESLAYSVPDQRKRLSTTGTERKITNNKVIKCLSIVPDGMDNESVKLYLDFNRVGDEELRSSGYGGLLNGKKFNSSAFRVAEMVDTSSEYYNAGGEVESRAVEAGYSAESDALLGGDLIDEYIEKFGSDADAGLKGMGS